MALRDLMADSKALRGGGRRVELPWEPIDAKELRKTVSHAQRVAVDLAEACRRYLADAQEGLARLEKETRPLRKEAAIRLAELEADTRPLRRRAMRRALDFSYDMLDRAESRSGAGRRRGGGRAFLAAMSGLAAGGAIGYVVADQRSRSALQGSLVRIQGEAKQRVPALVDRAGGTLDELRTLWARSGSGADEAALVPKVESAVRSQPGAEGLQVGVEGRTVYLRGSVGDRSALDGAIEKVRSVEGVAAVINLASVVSEGPSAERRKA